ncbi:MAG: tRNA (adenosine(37)-N6)-dimethylallyltransferase MiaA [candidate division WWE3 bacterium]|nr:tRNA (adenosine(37)-N6)-dimethylallyltransferase MiaA [candidate division WWE3 bacterium]
MRSNKFIVLVGPTSSGKTSKALELCKKFNGEVISADSRQLYKGMDIGTGKLPLSADRVDVTKAGGHWDFNDTRVWMYDVVNPGEYFSALDFKNKAEVTIDDVWKRAKVPFIVGGTGFYVETLLGLKSVANVSPNIKLREELDKLSVAELSTKLKEIDPAAWGRVDKNNPRRLQRAIEVSNEKNRHSELDSESSNWIPGQARNDISHSLILGFTAPHEILYPRADAWVDEALKVGLVEETQRLIDQGYGNTPQLNGLIYKVVKSYLADEVSISEMPQLIKYQIHDYIRRQETYFRKMPGVTWFDTTKKTFDEELTNKVESYLDG